MARLKLTIVLDSGARIGPGKVALLESVRETGSIAAAGRAMGMDYKRAWLLIDSLNRAFSRPAVERTTGGVGGGSATLTAFGEELLARYARFGRPPRSWPSPISPTWKAGPCPIPGRKSEFGLGPLLAFCAATVMVTIP